MPKSARSNKRRATSNKLNKGVKDHAGTSANLCKKLKMEKDDQDEDACTSKTEKIFCKEKTDREGHAEFKDNNKVAIVESSCQMKELCAPKIIKKLKSKIECFVGDRLSLDVTAVGTPQPEFKWFFYRYHKNSEIELQNQEDNIEMRFLESSNLYQLNFISIKKEMYGKYFLKLTNVAGEAETSCDLIINCKWIFFKCTLILNYEICNNISTN